MFKAEILLNKQDFVTCNMYYLRKYLGLKELLLVLSLGVAAVLLFLLYQIFWVLVLFAVCLALIGACVAFYYATAVAGYKIEYGKRNAEKQVLTFNELGFVIDTYEQHGSSKLTDKFLYADIDRIAIKEDRIYIFATVALNYYLKRESVAEGGFEALKTFLQDNIEPQKFKMKQKRKRRTLGGYKSDKRTD